MLKIYNHRWWFWHQEWPRIFFFFQKRNHHLWNNPAYLLQFFDIFVGNGWDWEWYIWLQLLQLCGLFCGTCWPQVWGGTCAGEVRHVKHETQIQLENTNTNDEEKKLKIRLHTMIWESKSNTWWPQVWGSMCAGELRHVKHEMKTQIQEMKWNTNNKKIPDT